MEPPMRHEEGMAFVIDHEVVLIGVRGIGRHLSHPLFDSTADVGLGRVIRRKRETEKGVLTRNVLP